MRQSSRSRSWLRSGCLGLAALIGLAVVIGVGFFGVVWMQVRSDTAELERADVALTTDPPAPSVTGETTRLRVVVDVIVAQLVVVPAPEGEPARLRSDHDRDRYVLEHRIEAEGARSTLYVALRPRGSPTLALFRAKLGAPIPRLRLSLPRDAVIDLEGVADRSSASMELGGLSLRSAEIEVENGAASISFLEPLQAPMDRIAVRGTGGGFIEVTTLGNASPAEAVFDQRFGAMDLDLRGPWSRDADLSIEGRIGGGSVWLPQGVTLEGLESTDLRPTTPPPELHGPTLRFSIEARTRRLIFVD